MYLNVIFVVFLGLIPTSSCNIEAVNMPVEGSNSPQTLSGELKFNFQDLVARMEAMEAREKKYSQEIESLRNQLSVQTQRTASLERKVWTLSRRSVQPNEDKQQTQESSTETRIQTPLQLTRPDQTPNRIRRAEVENQVAFFAKLTHDMTHVGRYQPIVFDAIETNIGNAYNNHVGVFVAPFRGTYVFSTTLFSHLHVNYHAMFARNGNLLTRMYTSGSEAGYSTTSQTIVLQLQKGDNVSVQNIDADKPIYGLSYTIFSGFLLQEDYQASTIVGK